MVFVIYILIFELLHSLKLESLLFVVISEHYKNPLSDMYGLLLVYKLPTTFKQMKLITR